MSLQDFHYHLPTERIAHTAAEPRDSARLLHWNGDAITHRIFSDLPTLLNPGDVLVLNDSRVIPARLHGVRSKRDAQGTDVPVEILLHQSLSPELTEWQAFVRPARRLKNGDIIQLPADQTATVLETADQNEESRGQVRLRLNLPPAAVTGYLEAHGHTPLPPYINAQDTPAVRARYQTVYADAAHPGSVAAPTAGLHFTEAVFAALKEKGVHVVHVTLHVGAGTFLNPTDEQVQTKQLHAEWATVPPAAAAAILAAKAAGGNVIAAGTTSLRTLESWARFGNMSASGWTGETRLFLQPGDAIHVPTHLLTNFHLPGSSLLMLVAACLGEDTLWRIYDEALAEHYRFFSFGDTSLLTIKNRKNFAATASPAV